MTVKTEVEPAVGEKRQREEDDQDTRASSRQMTSKPSTPMDTTANFVPANNGMAVSSPDTDALYIGDLQWVSLLVLPVAYIADFTLVDNGRRFKEGRPRIRDHH